MVSGEQAMISEMSDHEEIEEDQFEGELEAEIRKRDWGRNEHREWRDTCSSSARINCRFCCQLGSATVQRQHAVRNILRQRSGPHKDTEMLSIADTFKVIFTAEMVVLIVRHMNKKAYLKYIEHTTKRIRRKNSFHRKTSRELYGFLGILISSGVNNSNYDHTTDMWRSSSYPLYQTTMGINRFWNILRFNRFDDANTRGTRRG